MSGFIFRKGFCTAGLYAAFAKIVNKCTERNDGKLYSADFTPSQFKGVRKKYGRWVLALKYTDTGWFYSD